MEVVVVLPWVPATASTWPGSSRQVSSQGRFRQWYTPFCKGSSEISSGLRHKPRPTALSRLSFPVQRRSQKSSGCGCCSRARRSAGCRPRKGRGWSGGRRGSTSTPSGGVPTASTAYCPAWLRLKPRPPGRRNRGLPQGFRVRSWSWRTPSTRRSSNPAARQRNCSAGATYRSIR